MSKVLVNESSLTGIADAIRGKNGSTNTYKPSEMAAAITAISGGGGEPTIEALSITANGTYTAPDGVDGYSPVTVNVPQDGGPPESAFVITGNCSYRFARNGWNWFINNYGNKITTNNISDPSYMFYFNDNLTTIPFDLNLNGTSYVPFSNMFYSCINLQAIGKIINLRPSSMSYMFYDCRKLRFLPEIVNYNFSVIHDFYSSASSMFNCCHSLRTIPEDLLNQIYGTWTSIYGAFLYTAFQNCYNLDELKGLNPQTGTITSNMFNYTFYQCNRLKNIIFVLQDNTTPYVVNWKNQTIDLSEYVGYTSNQYIGHILNYNSGITEDKQVTDDATYQALKDDPDWWTANVAYSRYNHDSAVATINSLPDTSAYLAANGGTNTIMFKGAAGSATDGGAINTLTQEEIAVATAKGWSVVYV